MRKLLLSLRKIIISDMSQNLLYFSHKEVFLLSSITEKLSSKAKATCLLLPEAMELSTHRNEEQ